MVPPLDPGPLLSPAASTGPCPASPRQWPGVGGRSALPWLLPAVGLLALHLGHLLAGRRDVPALWFPPAGIGLVLAAWLGRRGVLLVMLDALLVLLQRYLSGSFAWRENIVLLVALDLGSIGLDGLEVLAAWWLYHRLAGGSRRLEDPHSATLFLFLIPGLAAGVSALLHALPLWLTGPPEVGLGRWAFHIWLGRALGLAVVAPPLLVLLTDRLVRWKLVAQEAPGERWQHCGLVPQRLQRGDRIELVGLTAGASLLGLLLTRFPGREGGDWQLWGVSFLVIVWATLRQGIRGGLATTGASAVVALSLATLTTPVGRAEVPLQLNLLAQGSAALLVTSSANWIRGKEDRYRRVIGHLPVVLYSVRGLRLGSRDRPLSAEITFLSPASQEVLGCPPEALLGGYEHWLEQVHPDDREVVCAAVAQLGRQKEPVTCEYRILGKVPAPGPATMLALSNSHVITLQPPPAPQCWVRDTLAPVYEADGTLEGWDGVVTDITEQRALAYDLRHTTSLFHALVAHLPAGIFFVHVPSGRPILVNARARQLLGQREELSVGLEHLVETYRLHRPDGTPYPADELPVTRAVRQGLKSMRDDIVVHRPDGRRLPLVTWAAPVALGDQGQAQAAVWVFEELPRAAS
jgi:PAS domain-containing protein